MICKKCVMDLSSPEITFDSEGKCNFCHQAQKSLAEIEKEKPNLPKIIEQIKKDGKGKEYDILMGLSGGVDSSTALVKAIELGLRPLCFTLDNKLNVESANRNIERLVEKFKVPFFKYEIDLKKYIDLQSAFMRAGLKNIEIPTDHILMAVTYKIASKNNIKWILSGGNVATESIMPESWGYNARDLVHIEDVYKQMTGRKLKGLPVCSLLRWNFYRWIRGIKFFYILDYLDYNRDKAIKELEEKLGWENYSEKHCENYYTWWFQNFYLYEKFGVDKRKAHLSSLINSGQMTRKEAMEKLLENPVYPTMGIEAKALKYPKREHSEFKMDKWYNRISKIIRILKLW